MVAPFGLICLTESGNSGTCPDTFSCHKSTRVVREWYVRDTDWAMAHSLNGSSSCHSSSWGLLNNNNYRALCRKAMMLRVAETTKTRRKRDHQKKKMASGLKRQSKDVQHGQQSLNTNETVKRIKLCSTSHTEDTLISEDMVIRTAADQLCTSSSSSVTVKDTWEVDSGFVSEASPPASGRTSPCVCPVAVVAMDCEMVGTGPGGHCNELARCSIVDYQGHVLYDKYVRPCQRVVDYRTRWSGIQRHHLQDAVPFTEARDEILAILEGKVVVGHSIDNDFRALDMTPPCHMVRDTSTNCILRRLSGLPRRYRISLKTLTSTLLKRNIQVGKRGHCSVEDALAALDLYKLVEEEWEAGIRNKKGSGDTALHYMEDQYWPEHLSDDNQ